MFGQTNIRLQQPYDKSRQLFQQQVYKTQENNNAANTMDSFFKDVCFCFELNFFCTLNTEKEHETNERNKMLPYASFLNPLKN